eukprot:CAMPEP_0198292512 /NCGR_PEP_ID=MMETSP1449-20131203/12443_1 /TAXON_ID=420275 /ORGANISM="Attheya septentrionalis, Strain CCMP2084" /LENGTH=45 /DNA_ID= /DNA_START= /DNA_END= /DNA_ORIENTATION=
MSAFIDIDSFKVPITELNLRARFSSNALAGVTNDSSSKMVFGALA